MKRLLCALAASLICATSARAQVARDSPATIPAAGGICTACTGPANLSFTNTNGDLLTCGITASDTTAANYTVTYNGAALTNLVHHRDNGGATANITELDYKVTPSKGTSLTLAISGFTNGSDVTSQCASWTGDTGTFGTPVSTDNAGVGSNTLSLNVTVVSSSGAAVFTVACGGACFGNAVHSACENPPTPGTTGSMTAGTLVTLSNIGGGTSGSNGASGQTTGASAGTVTHTYQLENSVADQLNISGVEIKPAVATGGPPLRSLMGVGL